MLDREIANTCKSKLLLLEQHFDSDVVFFYGEIHAPVDRLFRDFIEQLRDEDSSRKTLTIILNTPGGSAETTEKLVQIIRAHYNEVNFIVPDYALSAGTIWCMSGNRIYMDYSSSLSPIDPQVYNGEKYVPAMGYLDKVGEFIQKSNNNALSQAEFIMLRELDLAELRSYEQSRDLTISLLEEWLVRYKFAHWTHHRSDPTKKGKEVTLQEKRERATEIAKKLNDTSIWHSHGRAINIEALQKVLRLEIEDYSKHKQLRDLIRGYTDVITGYIVRQGFKLFLHSRNFF